MAKKQTSQRTRTWQERQVYQLWRIQKHMAWIRRSVFGLGAAYMLNAVAGRVWP